MSVPESLASAPNLFKVLYPDGISKPLYKRSPVLGKMKKNTQFFGNGTKYVVVSIAPGAGGSASIATAIANQSSTQEVRFQLGRKKLYEIGSIDGETLAAGRNDKGAIVDILKHTTGRSLDAFGRTLSKAVWNNGGGARGQIATTSTIGSPTIILTSRVDGAALFKGMNVQLAADDGFSGATGVIAGGVQATITQVQRKNLNGTTSVTIGANWNAAIPGAAVSQFLFRAGDYAAYPSGIPAWAPTADPTITDNFLSVNRFTAGDMNFLSGWRVSGGGQPKQQTIIDAAAEAQQNGVPDLGSVYLNPLDMGSIFKEQSTFKTIPVNVDGVTIGYKSATLQAAIGDLTCFAETDIPQGSFWMLNDDTWTMRSAGDVPMLLDADGISLMLRNPGSDDYQYRYGCYMNFENAEPNQAVIGSYA